jgi:hypothetical protein
MSVLCCSQIWGCFSILLPSPLLDFSLPAVLNLVDFVLHWLHQPDSGVLRSSVQAFGDSPLLVFLPCAPLNLSFLWCISCCLHGPHQGSVFQAAGFLCQECAVCFNKENRFLHWPFCSSVSWSCFVLQCAQASRSGCLICFYRLDFPHLTADWTECWLAAVRFHLFLYLDHCLVPAFVCSVKASCFPKCCWKSVRSLPSVKSLIVLQKY